MLLHVQATNCGHLHFQGATVLEGERVKALQPVSLPSMAIQVSTDSTVMIFITAKVSVKRTGQVGREGAGE
jgi:hypothetical protein